MGSAVARCHAVVCMGSICTDALRCSRAVCCASDSLGCSACAAGRRWWWWSRCCLNQGHKSLSEMREERQVHPNMETVFRRTYSSPSGLPSTANSTTKDADMHEEETCECVDCVCVECACGGLERGCREDNLAHYTLFCILHFVLCLVTDQESFCFCSE